MRVTVPSHTFERCSNLANPPTHFLGVLETRVMESTSLKLQNAINLGII